MAKLATETYVSEPGRRCGCRALSSDHRVVYGVLAAKFVNTVKAHLEDPKSLEA